MAEYIERETAVKAANEWVSEACMAPVMRVSRLFDKLQKVPAADVAPVVRCKDCKHLVAVNVNGKGIPTCRVSDMEVAPDEFCSRGEKGRR